MTFANYQNSNNASSKLLADISASTTIILITSWEEALFPNSFPFLLTIEKVNSDWNVILREIVKVVSWNQNSLVVVRWAWKCVQDDTATTRVQSNATHSFSAWDRISLYWTAEQVKDIQDKLETSANDSAIANEYDNTSTYAIWDVVMYKGDRYSCTTAVETAENFDSTKWTKISVQYNIDSLQTQVNDLASKSNASDHLEDEALVGSYYEMTDTMFRQETAKFDDSTVDWNIWSASTNSEIHIQRQWSWTESNQLKLKIKMWWSPTTSLVVEVRKWISVVNSNKKSSYWYWDSNNVIASATLPYTTFSSSWQEITVNLDNSFGWTEWELLDVVLYQASHVVNASNYYIVACDSTQNSDAFQYLRMADDFETIKQSFDIPYCVSDWFADVLLTRVSTEGAYALPRNLKTLWEKAQLTTYWRHIDWVWLDHKSEATIDYIYGGPYRTWTVKWQETSTPADAFLWYEDDAEWMTQWSSDRDSIFGFEWVRLNTSWAETWSIDLTNMSSETWLDTWDNVMVKFPIRWIKMSKSWNTITLSITNDPNAESEWFQYYAHSRWTFSSPVKKNAFYLWAYEWSTASSVLKSLSWATVSTNTTQNNFITYARANDWNSWNGWYDIVWFYQRMYISALYMMKYWNPNSQATIWNWNTTSWSKKSTWLSNSISWATGGDTSWTTSAMKLFWLENRRWNVREWIAWCCAGSDRVLYTALQWFVGDLSTSSPYESTWITLQLFGAQAYNISSVAWWQRTLFAPIGNVEDSWYTTYYCDNIDVSWTGAPLIVASGMYNNGSWCWIFYFNHWYNPTQSSAYLCARLMYL